MNIAIIVPSLTNKAPISIAISLAESYFLKEHSVTVFNLRGGCEIEIPVGINVCNISFFDPVDLSKFDIVHSHMLRPDAFVFIKKSLKNNFIAVSTIHNYVYPELRNYYNRIVSIFVGSLWVLLWRRFDALAVLTDDAVNYYSKIITRNKIFRIYNGRDIEIDKSSLDEAYVQAIRECKSAGHSVIGTYCNLIKRKGIDILIRHVSRVSSSSLVVFGDGPERVALENLANSLGVADRVSFFGAVHNAHQYSYLFDIFAIPSRDEGFGLALIEAALHKKSIICSNIPVFKELFDENSVTYFDLENENTIDDAVSVALASHDKSIKAHSKATNKFSVASMSESYISLYADMLAVKQAATSGEKNQGI